MDDDEILSALALAQLVELLRLGLSALQIVDGAEPTSLSDVRGLQDQCTELEIRTVALLREAGVPWEALAAELGVARQSLHRRLNRKIKKYKASPVVTEGRGLVSEWERLTSSLSTTLEALRSVGPRRISARAARTLRS
jgi:hypothetical protein